MFTMTEMNRSLAARALMSVAAVVMLSACATKGDLRDIRTEMQSLAARQDSLLIQLMTNARSTQDTVRTQSNQLFDFRGEITQQLRVIAESLETLEALAGENQRGIRGVRDQMANLRRAPTSQPTTTSGSGTDGAGGDQESVAGAAPDADRLYETAMAQYGRGSLTTARMAFEQLLSSHPNSERAPDAHYFLADVLYQQDDMEGALASYGEIRSRFPEATRVPGAMYRIGLILIEQEDFEEARAALESLVNTYPDSDEAQLAQERLDEIG